MDPGQISLILENAISEGQVTIFNVAHNFVTIMMGMRYSVSHDKKYVYDTSFSTFEETKKNEFHGTRIKTKEFRSIWKDAKFKIAMPNSISIQEHSVVNIFIQ